MNRVISFTLAALISLLALPTVGSAQESRDASRLFAREAEVTTDVTYGLARLPVPPDVLREVQPNFSDVRLFDASGTELPYIVDSGARRGSRSQSFTVVPTGVERRVDEGDSLALQFIERFVIAPPGGQSASRWTLVINSTRPTFVRSLVVRSTGENPSELTRGTVFRFGAPLRERTTIELPPLPRDAFGSVGSIEVELRGEEGYLEPSFEMRTLHSPVSATTLTLPLTENRREDADGTTTVMLERPPGFVPTRIRVSTTTGHFARQVRIYDQGPTYGDERLGEGLLFRAQELDGAEQVELHLLRANEELLRVEIDNADSPPLAELRFEAVLDQPSLLFEATSAPLTLRFGGARARAPQYDIQSLFGMVFEDDIGSLSEATLGPIGDNEAFDDGPALDFAMRAGRPIDTTQYSHVTPVTVAGARDGLSILRLSPAVLATARGDLADVRVVDGEGRQWPYLRQSQSEDEQLPVTVSAPTGDGDPSIYAIALPVDLATVRGFSVEVGDRYAARSYSLRGMNEHGRWTELVEGELYCDPQSTGGCRHVTTFSEERVSELQLRVDDGDDAPLALSSATVAINSDAFFLAAPDGEYRVFTGNPEATAPEYEIASAERLVLAVPSVDAQLGEPVENAEHVEPSWYERTAMGTWALWGLLLLAVLILGLLTARLSREAPEPPAGDGEAPDSDSDSDPDPDSDSDSDPDPDPDSDGDVDSKPITF